LSNTDQIVHESETQRQYIRLQLPASVEIDGTRYSLKDLSAGGLALRDIDTKEFKKSQRSDLKLILPFADFTIDLDLKAEIQYIDKKLKIAGCRFIDLTPSQISILNHVIRSFIAGDIEKNTDIISVVARDNFANIRKHQNDNENPSNAELIKRYSIYGFALIAIIAVSSFIIGNIMEKILVVKTNDAFVSLESINIISPLSGTYVSTLPEGIKTVEKNDPIAKIVNPESNDTIVVYSPCDCYITDNKVLNGQYTPKDQKLFELIRSDEKSVVTATMDLENAHRLKIGTESKIDITGLEAEINGKIINIERDNISSTLHPPQAIITIQPSLDIPIDYINRLAFVEFYL
jgi:alginate biosynthesis protein Alg44